MPQLPLKGNVIGMGAAKAFNNVALDSPRQQRNSQNPLLSTPNNKGRGSVSRLTGDTISSSLKKRQQGALAVPSGKSVGFKGPENATFQAPSTSNRGSYTGSTSRPSNFGFFQSGKGVSPGKALVSNR